MSLPRRFLRDVTYLVTRRCARRCFFLRPDRRTRRIVRYCLGRALELHPGISLHALVFESSHYHLVCTDRRAELPAFMRDLNALIARALNVRLGRGENFWASGSYSAVELHGEGAVMDKLLYTLTNPVKDGLVPAPEVWPGLISLPDQIGSGHRFRAERPDEPFFRQAGEGCLPERVEFFLSVPPAFAHLAPAEFRNLLKARLAERLAEVHAERQCQGKTRFLGAEAVLRQNPRESSGDTFPERDRDPCLSCKDPDRLTELRAELTLWRQRYREAWTRWYARAADVVFPAGTYLLRLLCGVSCGEERSVPVG